MKLGELISMNPNYAPNVCRRPLWKDINTFESIAWIHRGDVLVVLYAENYLPEAINNSRLKVLTQHGEIGWVRRGDYKKWKL